MARIAVGGVHHETNCFVKPDTDFAYFCTHRDRPPLVRGDDLIALGLKPGPRFGEILEAVETRQLEGTLRDREKALEWVKAEFQPRMDANERE